MPVVDNRMEADIYRSLPAPEVEVYVGHPRYKSLRESGKPMILFKDLGVLKNEDRLAFAIDDLKGEHLCCKGFEVTSRSDNSTEGPRLVIGGTPISWIADGRKIRIRARRWPRGSDLFSIAAEHSIDIRPSRDVTMMELARVIARRSTCPRRAVGAVLTDEYGRVLAMGHNGVAMGEPHCTDHPCGGESFASGEGLMACAAIHAEQNALLFCPDVMRIRTLYVTTSPCDLCVRMLLNTSCETILFHDLYDARVLERWTRAGRVWHQVDELGDGVCEA